MSPLHIELGWEPTVMLDLYKDGILYFDFYTETKFDGPPLYIKLPNSVPTGIRFRADRILHQQPSGRLDWVKYRHGSPGRVVDSEIGDACALILSAKEYVV